MTKETQEKLKENTQTTKMSTTKEPTSYPELSEELYSAAYFRADVEKILDENGVADAKKRQATLERFGLDSHPFEKGLLEEFTIKKTDPEKLPEKANRTRGTMRYLDSIRQAGEIATAEQHLERILKK